MCLILLCTLVFVGVCAGAGSPLPLPPPMVLSDVHAVFVVVLGADFLFLFSGAVQREYVVKLNDSQEALEKSQRLFEEKKEEMKELKSKLEEFAMDTEDMEVEQTMIHNRATSTSKESSRESAEHKNAVDSYRTNMLMLWEKMNTPMEHRMKFLETVVNEFSEVDEYVLQHMKHYSESLEKVTA